MERSKEGYYLALLQFQTTMHTDNPDWQGWLTFFLRSLRQQKRSLEAKLEREHITAASIRPLSQEVLTLATQHGRLTTFDIVQLTGANRSTVKKHLQCLVATHRFAQHSKSKGTWYGQAQVKL
ncbi:MAG: hypothetical protein ACMVY4_06760 [Minwuia sp.]|uniref:hypothetical protein n=1 Tax=Minwuia sp. TaxID=2493630 RepID=UPI003A838B1B